MAVLIGSRALNYYISVGRKLHDWDVIMSQSEYESFSYINREFWVKSTPYSHIFDINEDIVEIRNPANLDETDKILLHSSFDYPLRVTSFGTFCIPSVQILYDIKKATWDHIKDQKHQHDLDLIVKNFPVYPDSPFYKQRSLETRNRVEKSSKIEHDFFHKYHIPEYIKHDRIHDMFADLLDLNIPTYKRITVAETDISEDLFNKLTHTQKVSLMVEEVLVLNMERWFNAQMVENGINHRLIDNFYNNNEDMPTYQILKHVCLTGLKGEAPYITEFARNNFFIIELEWCKAKEIIKSKGGIPKSYLKELYEIRSQYRKGLIDFSKVI